MNKFTDKEIEMIIKGLNCSIDRLGFKEEYLEKELEELIEKIDKSLDVYYE